MLDPAPIYELELHTDYEEGDGDLNDLKRVESMFISPSMKLAIRANTVIFKKLIIL